MTKQPTIFNESDATAYLTKRLVRRKMLHKAKSIKGAMVLKDHMEVVEMFGETFYSRACISNYLARTLIPEIKRLDKAKA